MIDAKETISKVKEEIIEDHPEMTDEMIEKYISAFLKEDSTIRNITGFISYCNARKINIL
jgi:hypothetical protein